MSDTGEYYEYDRKEKTWKLITNITERGFDAEKAYGALKHMLKNVTVSDEKIQSAVTDYLKVNPVLPGATTEQAQQIEQNKTDVASLKEETGSLKEDLGNLVNGTQEVITIPDMIGSVAEYTGYEHKIAEVKTGEKWIVLFNTFSSAVSIRNMSNVSDSWNGVSSKMNTKNMCELQIPVDGSLRLNVEDASYSGTYYAYNVTNKAILSDYLEKNGINGLYKIYTEKNEEYIKQYADSIDPLTDSNLFSTKKYNIRWYIKF